MLKDRAARRESQAGYSLIELMITLVIIALLTSIAVPMFREALSRSHRASVAEEGRKFAQAMMAYAVDNTTFPAAVDLVTIAPLSTNGYFDNAQGFVQKLLGDTMTSYTVTPQNDEYFAVLTCKGDPTAVFVALRTDNWAGDPGTWYEGIYYLQGGNLVPVAEATRG